MKFQLIQSSNITTELWYKSSKEEILLGELVFVDKDGDERADILNLLAIILKVLKHPMIEVEVPGV